jgi:hypothetical protein
VAAAWAMPLAAMRAARAAAASLKLRIPVSRFESRV